MTDTPPDPPPTTTVPDGLGIAFHLTEGPDGMVWPTMQIRTLTLTCSVQIPQGQAKLAGEMIHKELTALSSQAKALNRQRTSGLVIAPDMASLRLDKPPNHN